MRVRRLRWMQSWARDPDNNAKWLAATFGTMEAEAAPTYVLGEGVRPSSKPLALRVFEGLRALSVIDDSGWALEVAGEDLLIIFKVDEMGWKSSLTRTCPSSQPPG